jgi:hypothetical protein
MELRMLPRLFLSLVFLATPSRRHSSVMLCSPRRPSSAQALEHDPDLLLWGELPTGTTADLTHCRFCGLLLPSSHIETLLGVQDPVSVS